MMIKDKNLRQKVIGKIKRLSGDKLDSVDRYIDQLENKINSSSEIIHFSGVFKDLDKEVMEDLTTKLHQRRLRGTSRIK
jgi:hypothetical protein